MRTALIVVLFSATAAQADLSTQSRGQVTDAVFTSHPGAWDREVVWLTATLRHPGACQLSASIGDQRLQVDATATGFTSTIAPPPHEGDRLKVGCGGALRDTGMVFRQSRLKLEGW